MYCPHRLVHRVIRFTIVAVPPVLCQVQEAILEKHLPIAGHPVIGCLLKSQTCRHYTHPLGERMHPLQVITQYLFVEETSVGPEQPSGFLIPHYPLVGKVALYLVIDIVAKQILPRARVTHDQANAPQLIK